MVCPNCGHQLVGYRTERQSGGRRDFLLEWSICTNCQHVALQQWSAADNTSESNAAEQHLRRLQPPQQATG